MPDPLQPETLGQEISDFEARVSELRQAATLPGTDPRATLDAALVELDLALSALRSNNDKQVGTDSAADLERRVLRTVVHDAPVPLFVLEPDMTVRRVNRQASTILDSAPGYTTGKPFSVFCDLRDRASLRSQIAGVVRTGRRRQVTVRFLRRGSPIEILLVLARVWVRGEPEPLVVAAAMPKGTPAPSELPAPPAYEADSAKADETVAALVHRTDILTRATELLLKDRSFTESVAVRRCARLLANELADWVIVDLCDEGGILRRKLAIGPSDDASTKFARVLQDLDPRAGTLPAEVHRGGRSTLLPAIDDLGVLGATEPDVPVCALMNVTSILSVPLNDGEAALGALTVAVNGDHSQFDLIDLGLVERVGRLLALEIQADRIYRRRAEVANALQSSLLPRELPKIDGLETDARYIAATRGVDVGGDFYDVFTTPAGWGFVLGDVCGKGEEAAAVTATARQGVRLLARWDAAPESVFTKVNEALLADHDRFVTAVMASVRWHNAKLRVELGSAGHQPAIVIRNDSMVRTSTGGGMPLGLFEDLTPGVEVLDLSPGDTLFLHSDGVLDACDGRQEPFGMERLIETLAARSDQPVSELVTGVERALIDYCDGDLRDDVSILALRVLEPSTV